MQVPGLMRLVRRDKLLQQRGMLGTPECFEVWISLPLTFNMEVKMAGKG